MLRNDETKLSVLRVLKKHKTLSINQLKRATGVVNYARIRSALDFLIHKDINLVSIKDGKDKRGTKLVSLQK